MRILPLFRLNGNNAPIFPGKLDTLVILESVRMKKNEDKHWIILFIIVSILSLIAVSALTFILQKILKG
jgi:hypothetical protein